MEFLIFSDLHLNKFPCSNITKEGENELLISGLNIIDQVYNKAVDCGIRTIFFCGDLFHTRSKIDPEIYSNFVYEKFRKYFGKQSKCQLIIIPGNHDQINKIGTHFLKPYSEIENVYVIDDLCKRDDFILCPHQYNTERLYTFLKNNSDENSIVFMHQLIFNSPIMSGAIFRKNEAVDVTKFKYKYLFSGHNHRPFENKKLNVCNMGSPMHYDFGDAECQDRFMVHYKDGSVTWHSTVFPHFAIAGTENEKNETVGYVKKQNKKVAELTSRLQIEWNDETTHILKSYIKSTGADNPDTLLHYGLNLLV